MLLGCCVQICTLPEYKRVKSSEALLTVFHAHLRTSHLEPAIPTATSKCKFLCHFLAGSQITEGNRHEIATTEWRGECTAKNTQGSASVRLQRLVRVQNTKLILLSMVVGDSSLSTLLLYKMGKEISIKNAIQPHLHCYWLANGRIFLEHLECPIIPSRE